MGLSRFLPSALAHRFLKGGASGTAIRGSAGALVIKCTAMLLGFVSSTILARLLGVDGFGTYSLVLGWILLCVTPIRVGFVGVIVRELAGYKALGEWGKAKGLLIFGNTIGMTLSVIAAAGLGIVWRIGDERSGITLEIAGWALLLLPLYCLSSLRAAALRGLGKVWAGLFPDEIMRPLVQVILLVTAVFIVGWKLTPTLGLQVHLLATTAAFAIGAVMLWRSLPGPIAGAKAEFLPRTWLVPALSFALVSGFGTISQSLVVVVVGSSAGHGEVGLFKVAQQLSALVGLGMVAFNSACAPHVASLFKTGQREELSRLLRDSALLMSAFTLPLALLVGVSGWWLLPLLFGAGFEAAYMALILLCVGQMIAATMGLVGLMLNMAGYERDTLIGCALAIVVTLTSAVVFSRMYGSAGAAAAVVLGQFTLQMILAWRVRVRIGLSTTVFARLTGRR